MSVQAQAQIQETQKLAPNNIPVPWYSQKIAGCPYSHCSLASSLMVFDYFKGMRLIHNVQPRMQKRN